VIGRGFGHGVGMSQWGAHAMALRGMTHQQILGHYYRGTTLTVDGVR
jgi:stage II sporulation protein D